MSDSTLRSGPFWMAQMENARKFPDLRDDLIHAIQIYASSGSTTDFTAVRVALDDLLLGERLSAASAAFATGWDEGYITRSQDPPRDRDEREEYKRIATDAYVRQHLRSDSRQSDSVERD